MEKMWSFLKITLAFHRGTSKEENLLKRQHNKVDEVQIVQLSSSR